MEDRNRWILLLKELRSDYQVSILDAERIALGRQEWRRWVERQINTDPQCQRMAYKHIRYNGKAALLEQQDGRYVVK